MIEANTGSGDKDRIMEQIMLQHGRWIRALARDNAPENSWEDLEQEILLALWQSLDRFCGRSNLSTFVYSVVQNTVRGFSRRSLNLRRRDARVYPASGLVERDHDEAAILGEFRGSLSDLDRQVFVLYLEDVGYRQMSELTGMDETALRKRMSRIKEQFKATYNGR